MNEDDPKNHLRGCLYFPYLGCFCLLPCCVLRSELRKLLRKVPRANIYGMRVPEIFGELQQFFEKS